MVELTPGGRHRVPSITTDTREDPTAMLTAEQVAILVAAFEAAEQAEAAALAARILDADTPLTDDELGALETACVELGDGEVDLAVLEVVTVAAEWTRTEAAARYEAAAVAEAEAQALRDRLHGEAEASDTDPDPDAEPEAEPEGDPDPVVEPEADPAPEAERQPEPVAAAAERQPVNRPTPRQVAAHRPDRQRTAPANRGEDRPRGRTSVLGPDGEPLSDTLDITRAMLAAHRSTARVRSGYSERVPVAQFRAEYPDDRILGEDEQVNEQRIAALTASLDGVTFNDFVALVAAAGLCAPLEVLYDTFVRIGTNARPVKAGLQGYRAVRGGIRFRESAPFEDFNGAVNRWTIENDEDVDPDDDDTWKPCFDVPCGDFNEAQMWAVVECLTFNNISARTDPESVRFTTDQTMDAFARKAETFLLDSLKTASKKVIAGQHLGASRDLLYAWSVAAEGIRSRRRMNPGAIIELCVPSWWRSLFRNDIMRSLPAYPSQMAETDATINSWLNALNIRVGIEYLDSPSTGESQVFAAQPGSTSTAALLLDYPAEMQWGMWHPGAHLFLDGGELDLGTFRDSDLIRQNKYRTFMETFEGHAYTGVESTWGTSDICPNGASSGTVDPSDLCTGIYVPEGSGV